MEKVFVLAGPLFPFREEEMLPASETGDECEVSHYTKSPRLYLSQNGEFYQHP